ncbi:MAG: CZB domain-containing protein [Malikia sp.]|nr:CZB domain-containing protein [Malikia sp.]MDD2729996.1 CZB domain-containing protein [Malikia sp.]
MDAVELRQQQCQPGADGVVAQLDFDRAIESHHQWRVTLRNSIARKLKVDVDRLRRDDCCELGRWLHGSAGQGWGSNPAFTRLLQHHRDFHQEAGRIGDLINQSQLREAERLVGPGQPFNKAGLQVVADIVALRQAVQGGARSVASVAPLRAARPSGTPVREPVAAEADWETF